MIDHHKRQSIVIITLCTSDIQLYTTLAILCICIVYIEAIVKAQNSCTVQLVFSLMKKVSSTSGQRRLSSLFDIKKTHMSPNYAYRHQTGVRDWASVTEDAFAAQTKACDWMSATIQQTHTQKQMSPNSDDLHTLHIRWPLLMKFGYGQWRARGAVLLCVSQRQLYFSFDVLTVSLPE